MMSELGFQHLSGSSNLGLTFIRPLPQGGIAHSALEADGSSVRGPLSGLSERLFPPRGLEEAGTAPPVAGVELGHFVMEERIGRGGMGAVFRAVDKRLGRVVAVKVLTSEHSSDPEAVLRFQNEARAAARLDHENIARVHYIGEEHGLHFIAFEFVLGTNVRNLILQRGLLPVTDAVNYTLQIAEALRHTSAANVVHRDIKPSNIIVSTSGRAKLVDLGLARHSNPDLSRELTTVGTALGTFDYIAPEQALDARNVDIRSDIYSLGCTLYHMLTGSPPYPTGTMFEKVMNHHRPTPPNPTDKNRSVSPQLARVVQKMMAANPEDRYETPDSLIEDLVSIADDLGLQPTVPDAKIWQIPVTERRFSRWNGLRTWSTVALILIVVVLADRLRSLPPPDSSTTRVLDNTPVVDNMQPSVTPGSPVDPPQRVLGQNSPIPQQMPPEAPLETTPSIKVPSMAGTGIFSSEDTQIPIGLDPAVGLKPGMTRPESPQKPAEGTPGERPADPAIPADLVGKPRPAPAAPMPGTPGSETGTTPRPGTEMNPNPMEPPAVSLQFVAIKPAPGGMPMMEERFPAESFAAACALAKDGWTIEIPINRPVLHVLETVQLVDKRIKLRPAQEYRPGIDVRPVLRIDLSLQNAAGSFSNAAPMLSLDRSSVELIDLDLEMVVDPTATLEWSIASLRNGSRLTAQGVSFTMVNPGNSQAAIVSVPAAETVESTDLMPPERMPSRQNQVELKDCICRGQCDFVLQQDRLLNIDLRNTALALSGCLLRIDGSDSYFVEMDSDQEQVVSVLLDHVTLIAARGLLNANSGEHGSLPEIQIEMNDSVCSVLSDDQIMQPLLTISGHEGYEVLLDQIVFRNNRDPSFIQLTGPFSMIDSTRAQLPGVGREVTADDMGARNFRQVSSHLLQISPNLKITDWHRIRRSDFELRPGEDNPAIDTSGNLHNAGVDWHSSRLPAALPRGEN